MKTYGTHDWTEVASLSRRDSKRRAKAFRSRARQAGRAQCDEELAHYYADCVSDDGERVVDEAA